MKKSPFRLENLSSEQADLIRTAGIKADELFDFADKHLPESNMFRTFKKSLETTLWCLELAIAQMNEEKPHGDVTCTN